MVEINVMKEIIIVSDLREGAGMLGERYAAEMGYEVAEFPYYDVSSMGKMFNYTDKFLCFWNGEKNQTSYLMSLADIFNVDTIIMNYSDPGGINEFKINLSKLL